jgi:hypothetical protein
VLNPSRCANELSLFFLAVVENQVLSKPVDMWDNRDIRLSIPVVLNVEVGVVMSVSQQRSAGLKTGKERRKKRMRKIGKERR